MIRNKTKFLFAALAAIYTASAFAIDWNTKKTLYWDWSKINTDDVKFPTSFEWGTRTIAYLHEGWCKNSDFVPGQKGVGGSEVACDHWNLYKEDIKLMKNLGMNTYVFNVEWSKIETSEGSFDPDALQHYQDVCDTARSYDIKPVVILHHYSNPQWFANKGGFSKEENIKYFVQYARVVFEHLGSKVERWITINNPAAYAAKAHITGEIPPHENRKFQEWGQTLKNILQAHVEAYYAIKNKPNGHSAQIGIAKHIYPLEPWHRWNPLDHFACYLANKIANDLVYQFFTTGTIKVKIPLTTNIDYTNTGAKNALDFIGLNHFSHGYMKNFKEIASDKEPSTGSNLFTHYPEGLYLATKELWDKLAKEMDIPIYVTENAIWTNDATLRDRFYKEYLYALSKAITEGCDVRGYTTWFMDAPHAWGDGTKEANFGIVAVDKNTQERKTKDGIDHLLNTAKRFS